MINFTRKDNNLYRKQLKKHPIPVLSEMLGDIINANRNLSLHMRLDSAKKAWAIADILKERGVS